MTIFEELLSFDRPFVPVTLAIGNHSVECLARRPSAEEEDQLDAIYADEYGRSIIEKTTVTDDAVCELNRVRNVYLIRPKSEVMDQILGTRQGDIQKRALELLGLSPQEIVEAKRDLDEEAQKAYDDELAAKLKETWKEALAEIESEYADREFPELCDLMAQVNINMQALTDAARAKSAARLHFQVFTEDHERVFPDLDKIRNLSGDTIRNLGQTVEIALMRSQVPDLPFVSPDAAEPDAPPSSPSDSAVDSEDGGTPTKRRRTNSKPSTRPA